LGGLTAVILQLVQACSIS